MLLIISEENDISTIDVIDWLVHFNIPFIRINDTTKVTLTNFIINNEGSKWEFLLKNNFLDNTEIVKSERIKSLWYRRGEISLDTEKFYCDNNIAIFRELNKHLYDNERDIVLHIYNQLSSLKHVGDFRENYTNKLNNLLVAANCKLNIPPTSIVSNKIDLQHFLRLNKKCITKGVRNNSFGILGEVGVGCLTKLIEDNEIEKLSDIFSASLVQKYVEKLFEIRIFYFNGICYSSAIFSQNDEKTKVDFRDYNYSRPNRVVPYQLPEEIEKKIDTFMRVLKMESGSLDFIFSDGFEYVFLEVNPVGQFGSPSSKCNYHLDKIIATHFNN